MASATVQHIPAAPFASLGGTDDRVSPITATQAPEVPRHDVETTLNYYKENEDGSPPAPTYVDRPETYDRPVEVHNVTIHDVAGHEKEFTLDGNGFQLHKHTSVEKDFVDDDQIKASYYPEVEQLLKDV